MQMEKNDAAKAAKTVFVSSQIQASFNPHAHLGAFMYNNVSYITGEFLTPTLMWIGMQGSG